MNNNKGISFRHFMILVTFLKNNRLSDYENQLKLAIERGYNLCGIFDFVKREDHLPCVILRHDVDVPNMGLREMLAVEKKIGINSSWYFRWKTAEKNIIQDIQAAGSEVGLHFETLADICRQKHISSKAGISANIIRLAQSRLKEEISTFRNRYNTPCQTIASHGHYLNRKIQMANNEIVTPELYESMEITVEAYDHTLLEKVDCYISDDNLLQNCGWRYGTSLYQAIKKGRRTICFLSHPNHWFLSYKQRLKSILKLFIKGVQINQRQFKANFK